MAVQVDAVRAERVARRGGRTLQLPGDPGRVDLPALLQALAVRGCNEVHVEAGAGLNGALLQAGLADEVLIYLAPTLLGDQALGLCRLPVPEPAGQRRLDVIDQQDRARYFPARPPALTGFAADRTGWIAVEAVAAPLHVEAADQQRRRPFRTGRYPPVASGLRPPACCRRCR